MFAARSAGSCVTGRMLVHMAVGLDETHCGVSYYMYRCRSTNVSGLFFQRCIVHHVSRLPSSSILPAYRLGFASIWAMRGLLYSLGMVLSPPPHPDSSMYHATLFIAFLGLSIMFVFGFVMLSQSLSLEMAHGSPDACSLWLRHNGRESYFNVAIQNEACIMPCCIIMPKSTHSNLGSKSWA